MSPLRSLATTALAVTLLAPAAACASTDDSPAGSLAGSQVASDRGAGDTHVLAVSVDGLNVRAIRKLGRRGTPTLHRMLARGAGTLNARTEVEQTVTLPNHTSMMTGRRINAARGGHGVTWDVDRRHATVQQAAGHPVASVFSRVHADGGSTALYSTKAKFGLYERSWPAGIDRFRVRENQRRLVRMARADLVDGAPRFTFLHVSLPDRFGHEYGGMSAPYLDAVRRTDRQLGTVLRAVAGSDVDVVLTADHGFATGETSHSTRTDLENYRVPFVVWGPDARHGDLYAMNPRFRDPGTAQPSYARRQPVRNGDVANLALDLLGLGAVPGSELDANQTLQVR